MTQESQPQHAVPAPDNDRITARRRWLSVLAQAPLEALEQRLALAAPAAPGFRFLRAPETGLAMLRARAGGSGGKFNLGEITVTRCAVRLDSGEVGVGYVSGRSARHSELAALVDAMMQSPTGPALEAGVIAPLESMFLERAGDAAQRADSTRVEFFTLVRGAEPGAAATAGPEAGA